MDTRLEKTNNLFTHVSRIASAYITTHKTPLEELSTVITRVFQTLVATEDNRQALTLNLGKKPAVPVNESVHDDYIICLEDGKKLHVLKRHLGSLYGMTLDQYKARWNLPHDYPTVSPSYARRRSAIAHNIGLGKNGRRKAHLNVV